MEGGMRDERRETRDERVDERKRGKEGSLRERAGWMGEPYTAR